MTFLPDYVHPGEFIAKCESDHNVLAEFIYMYTHNYKSTLEDIVVVRESCLRKCIGIFETDFL